MKQQVLVCEGELHALSLHKSGFSTTVPGAGEGCTLQDAIELAQLVAAELSDVTEDCIYRFMRHLKSLRVLNYTGWRGIRHICGTAGCHILYSRFDIIQEVEVTILLSSRIASKGQVAAPVLQPGRVPPQNQRFFALSGRETLALQAALFSS